MLRFTTSHPSVHKTQFFLDKCLVGKKIRPCKQIGAEQNSVQSLVPQFPHSVVINATNVHSPKLLLSHITLTCTQI